MRSSADVEILVFAYLRPKETVEIVRKCLDFTVSPVTVYIDGAKDLSSRRLQREMIDALNGLSDRVSVHARPRNFGCREAIISGLEDSLSCSPAQFFIILEDDCVPSADFFKLVHSNLERLETDILTVGGSAPLPKCTQCEEFLSSYLLIHGWAVSRKKLALLLERSKNPYEFPIEKAITWKAKIFWKLNYLKVEIGLLDTWDTHFMVASWTLSEKNIISTRKLVENVGYVSTRDLSPISHVDRTNKKLHHTGVCVCGDESLLRDFFCLNTLSVLKWILGIVYLHFVQHFKRDKRSEV